MQVVVYSHAIELLSVVISNRGEDYAMFLVSLSKQETQLPLTNRATRLEVSQGHQTGYHMLRMVSYYCAAVTLSVCF